MMSRVFSPPSSMVSTLTYSPRREVTRASRGGHVRAEMVKSNKILSGSSSTSLCSCGRKHFLESTSPATTMMPLLSFNHQRPDWYKELFAWFLNTWMGSYEAEIADYKKRLFDNLTGKAEKVLEIGVGTGPNLKYYAKNENVCVFGMDPNQKMEKYANESAREAGLKPENFSFMQGVGEAIPLDDASVDAVVTTLVLCSVSDVKQTLNEGSNFRHVQNILDPLQQVVVDGCHLTRNTGLYISDAGFDGGAEIKTADFYSFPWIIRPHVYGMAYK